MIIERDATKIVNLLQKKGRASAGELGTNRPTMAILEEAKIVRQDGTIKTGQKGKPPAAFVLVEGADLNDLPVIPEPGTRERTGDGITQEQIDKQLAEVKEILGKECSCVCREDSVTLEQIRAFKGGCKHPNWVCGALDALRRRLKVY